MQFAPHVTDAYTIDFETLSTANIKKVGAWKYSEHPTTKVICLAYAKASCRTPGLWMGGSADSGSALAPLYDHIRAGGIIAAWNVGFERAIWENIMVPIYGAPEIKPEQWRCTMAAAMYRGFPASLDVAGKALEMDQDQLKLDEGKALINALCKPKRATQKFIKELTGWDTKLIRSMLVIPELHEWPEGLFLHPDTKGRIVPHYFNEDAELIAKMGVYCKQDVTAEIAVHHKVCQPDGEWLPPKELKIWQLDQKMNSRGIMVDLPKVKKAIQVFETVRDFETAKLKAVIGDDAIEPTSREALLTWIKSQGVDIPNMQKGVLSDIMRGELPDHVREVIRIRLAVGRSSILKLYSMLMVPGADARARGLLRYFGASTGRWSGQLIQPQNLARPNPRYEEIDPDVLLDIIAQGDIDFLEMLSDGDAIDIIMSAIRHFFCAAEGKMFVASDFAAIESVVLFSMAGQEDMVQAIRDGKRLYSLLATQIYGYTVTKKTHPVEDAAGKAGILGLGYQMGAKALVEFAHVQLGIEMSMETALRTVDTYRGSNTQVKAMWNGLNKAAIKALKSPLGTEVRTNYSVTYRTVIINDVKYLLARLPSGRDLHYPKPELRLEETPWSRAARDDWEEAYKGGLTNDPCPEPEYQEGVSYWTMKLGQWRRVRGYGGHWTENVVQAVARDLLADAMLRLDDNGFYLILSVHDEIVSEEDEDRLEEFEQLLVIKEEFAKDWPVTCEGWVGKEYRK